MSDELESKSTLFQSKKAKKAEKTEYALWLKGLKTKIRSTQLRAALAANSVLLDFYFDLGRMILEKDAVWGSKFLERLSADLKKKFPDMQGFSVTNLKYSRLFFEYLKMSPQAGGESKTHIIPSIGGQLPWSHIKNEKFIQYKYNLESRTWHSQLWAPLKTPISRQARSFFRSSCVGKLFQYNKVLKQLTALLSKKIPALQDLWWKVGEKLKICYTFEHGRNP